MKTVSMVEFRKNAENIIEQVRKGQRLVLTYRGVAVARLEPFRKESVNSEDPFYALATLADAKGESLTNEEMDEVVYGA